MNANGDPPGYPPAAFPQAAPPAFPAGGFPPGAPSQPRWFGLQRIATPAARR